MIEIKLDSETVNMYSLIDSRLLDLLNQLDIKLFEMTYLVNRGMVPMRGLGTAGVYNHSDFIGLNIPFIQSRGYNVNDVLLHEIGHATGHPIRLNRIGISYMGFTQENMLHEEAIAQYFAFYMGIELGYNWNESYKFLVYIFKYLSQWGKVDHGRAKSEARQAVNYIKRLTLKQSEAA